MAVGWSSSGRVCVVCAVMVWKVRRCIEFHSPLMTSHSLVENDWQPMFPVSAASKHHAIRTTGHFSTPILEPHHLYIPPNATAIMVTNFSLVRLMSYEKKCIDKKNLFMMQVDHNVRNNELKDKSIVKSIALPLAMRMKRGSAIKVKKFIG